MRAHWFALPLLRSLAGLGAAGTVQVRLAEGEFHVRVGGDPEGFGDGPAPEAPDVLLTLDAQTCVEVSGGALTVGEGLRAGRIELSGDGVLAKALRET